MAGCLAGARRYPPLPCYAESAPPGRCPAMDFKDTLKSQLNIADVIGQYVRLKKSGAGTRFLGLCPFHSEKSPSFNVNGDQQYFKCFGCQEGGDVFAFVHENRRRHLPRSRKVIGRTERNPDAGAISKRRPGRAAARGSVRNAGQGSRHLRSQPARSARRRSAAIPGQPRRLHRHRANLPPWARRWLRPSDPAAPQKLRTRAVGRVGLGEQTGRRQPVRPFPHPPDLSNPRRSRDA